MSSKSVSGEDLRLLNFAATMKRWAESAESDGRTIAPDAILFMLDQCGIYIPRSIMDELGERGA